MTLGTYRQAGWFSSSKDWDARLLELTEDYFEDVLETLEKMLKARRYSDFDIGQVSDFTRMHFRTSTGDPANVRVQRNDNTIDVGVGVGKYPDSLSESFETPLIRSNPKGVARQIFQTVVELADKLTLSSRTARSTANDNDTYNDTYTYRRAGWFSSDKGWDQRFYELLADYTEDCTDEVIKGLKSKGFGKFKAKARKLVDCVGPKGEEARILFDNDINDQTIIHIKVWRGSNSYESETLDLAGTKPNGLAHRAVYTLNQLSPE